MGHANLKFWKAWESPDIERRRPDDFDKDRRTLIVTGKVEVEAATTPMLEEDTGRSSAKTLYLNFPALKAGKAWKPVWFQKEIKSGDYEKVHLLVDGESATRGEIEIK